jgi:hypothetical protein
MNALFVTLLHGLLQASILILFPALALRGWRTGGSRNLVFAATGGLAVIAVVALTMASEWFGNRLSSTYGYPHIASRILILYMITLGLPVLTVASVIRAWQPAARGFAKPYSVVLATSLVAWAGAVILSIYVMPFLG